jgi:hypothetical protein
MTVRCLCLGRRRRQRKHIAYVAQSVWFWQHFARLGLLTLFELDLLFGGVKPLQQTCGLSRKDDKGCGSPNAGNVVTTSSNCFSLA